MVLCKYIWGHLLVICGRFLDGFMYLVLFQIQRKCFWEELLDLCPSQFFLYLSPDLFLWQKVLNLQQHHTKMKLFCQEHCQKWREKEQSSKNPSRSFRLSSANWVIAFVQYSRLYHPAQRQRLNIIMSCMKEWELLFCSFIPPFFFSVFCR